MSEMMQFTTWFISQLPGFLMSPPISAFTSLAILFWVANLFRRMIHV